jgi:hypothetical protein
MAVRQRWKGKRMTTVSMEIEGLTILDEARALETNGGKYIGYWRLHHPNGCSKSAPASDPSGGGKQITVDLGGTNTATSVVNNYLVINVVQEGTSYAIAGAGVSAG